VGCGSDDVLVASQLVAAAYGVALYVLTTIEKAQCAALGLVLQGYRESHSYGFPDTYRLSVECYKSVCLALA
jgi:hypothetical protein